MNSTISSESSVSVRREIGRLLDGGISGSPMPAHADLLSTFALGLPADMSAVHGIS